MTLQKTWNSTFKFPCVNKGHIMIFLSWHLKMFNFRLKNRQFLALLLNLHIEIMSELAFMSIQWFSRLPTPDHQPLWEHSDILPLMSKLPLAAQTPSGAIIKKPWRSNVYPNTHPCAPRCSLTLPANTLKVSRISQSPRFRVCFYSRSHKSAAFTFCSVEFVQSKSTCWQNTKKNLSFLTNTDKMLCF